MKKMLLSGVLSLGLIFGSVSPALASNDIVVPQDKILSIELGGSIQHNAISESQALDSFITVSNGRLKLDAAGKDVVSAETYALVESGIEVLNSSIAIGASVIDLDNKIVVPNGNFTPPTQSGDLISPRASFGTYWWGVALTMSQSETKDLIYSLRQVAAGFATEATLAALLINLVGGPQIWAATAAGALVSLGALLVSNSLEHHNNSKGVTLNIHWLLVPYYEVTKNS
ncbi:hypothetical protein ACFOQM_07120 [Paenibacillus sp. GCM10012307]|uniref:Uncharacterized protein n=1 Tax=Paenibacillus roseus TaxID=2798579 RepID=A0A934J3Y5_9BACL|nr:hypothetical protein [Paenibacillus roseus]MBJ6361068.1 hypothetical protein [Paenibacillus roseus]